MKPDGGRAVRGRDFVVWSERYQFSKANSALFALTDAKGESKCRTDCIPQVIARKSKNARKRMLYNTDEASSEFLLRTDYVHLLCNFFRSLYVISGAMILPLLGRVAVSTNMSSKYSKPCRE